MNERIEKLVIETLGKQGVPERRAFGYWAMSDEQMVKFAELIVKECSGIVYNYPEKYLTRNQAREICLSMEEYFGVK